MSKTDYLKQVCKIGQGAECCRYVVAGQSGIACAKLSEMKATIDDRVAKNLFTAIADNCEGKAENIPLVGLTVTT